MLRMCPHCDDAGTETGSAVSDCARTRWPAHTAVLVYGYMFTVCKTYDIPFLPWASVTLFWVAIMCALLALFNTCAYIHHFTRFSGELFGLLIAVLFLQQVLASARTRLRALTPIDMGARVPAPCAHVRACMIHVHPRCWYTCKSQAITVCMCASYVSACLRVGCCIGVAV